MKLDPKSDVRFQTAIQAILATMHTTYGADLLADDAATRTLVGNLIDLRTDFVIAVWVHSKLRKPLDKQPLGDFWSEPRKRYSPPITSKEEESAFGKFALLRDTKEAQEFLRKNLYFFARIDAQFYATMKDAVNARIA